MSPHVNTNPAICNPLFGEGNTGRPHTPVSYSVGPVLVPALVATTSAVTPILDWASPTNGPILVNVRCSVRPRPDGSGSNSDRRNFLLCSWSHGHFQGRADIDFVQQSCSFPIVADRIQLLYSRNDFGGNTDFDVQASIGPDAPCWNIPTRTMVFVMPATPATIDIAVPPFARDVQILGTGGTTNTFFFLDSTGTIIGRQSVNNGVVMQSPPIRLPTGCAVIRASQAGAVAGTCSLIFGLGL